MDEKRPLKRLRELREAQGLFQTQFAKIIGFHNNTISRYERGVVTPQLKKARKIAKYFGVTVDEILSID